MSEAASSSVASTATSNASLEKMSLHHREAMLEHIKSIKVAYERRPSHFSGFWIPEGYTVDNFLYAKFTAIDKLLEKNSLPLPDKWTLAILDDFQKQLSQIKD